MLFCNSIITINKFIYFLFPIVIGLSRGTWRGKMGTGIWANFHWENGILVTGTGKYKQMKQ